MGLILPQMVYLKTSNKYNNYYKELGYDLPTHIGKSGKEVFIEGAEFVVHVLDLKQSSNAKVKVQCDICDKIFELQYEVYNRYVYKGKYNCHDCIGESDKQKEKLKIQYEGIKPTLINELTNYIKNNGYPSSVRKCFHSKNNMHSPRIYTSCFGGGLVDWIEACGFILGTEEKQLMLQRGKPSNITKEDATKLY
jgi:hypothetical protein